MQRLHISTPFRLFMQIGYPIVVLGAVVAYIHYSVITFPLLGLATKSGDEIIALQTNLVYIVAYAPIAILIMSFLAWRVMLRHYRRLDEAREIIMRKGGQVSVDADLAELAHKWLEASNHNDTSAMDAVKLAFEQSASWYRRMRFRVSAFSTYLDTQAA